MFSNVSSGTEGEEERFNSSGVRKLRKRVGIDKPKVSKLGAKPVKRVEDEAELTKKGLRRLGNKNNLDQNEPEIILKPLVEREEVIHESKEDMQSLETDDFLEKIAPRKSLQTEPARHKGGWSLRDSWLGNVSKSVASLTTHVSQNISAALDTNSASNSDSLKQLVSERLHDSSQIISQDESSRKRKYLYDLSVNNSNSKTYSNFGASSSFIEPVVPLRENKETETTVHDSSKKFETKKHETEVLPFPPQQYSQLNTKSIKKLKEYKEKGLETKVNEVDNWTDDWAIDFEIESLTSKKSADKRRTKSKDTIIDNNKIVVSNKSIKNVEKQNVKEKTESLKKTSEIEKSLPAPMYVAEIVSEATSLSVETKTWEDFDDFNWSEESERCEDDENRNQPLEINMFTIEINPGDNDPFIRKAISNLQSVKCIENKPEVLTTSHKTDNNNEENRDMDSELTKSKYGPISNTDPTEKDFPKFTETVLQEDKTTENSFDQEPESLLTFEHSEELAKIEVEPIVIKKDMYKCGNENESDSEIQPILDMNKISVESVEPAYVKPKTIQMEKHTYKYMSEDGSECEIQSGLEVRNISCVQSEKPPDKNDSNENLYVSEVKQDDNTVQLKSEDKNDDWNDWDQEMIIDTEQSMIPETPLEVPAKTICTESYGENSFSTPPFTIDHQRVRGGRGSISVEEPLYPVPEFGNVSKLEMEQKIKMSMSTEIDRLFEHDSSNEWDESDHEFINEDREVKNLEVVDENIIVSQSKIVNESSKIDDGKFSLGKSSPTLFFGDQFKNQLRTSDNRKDAIKYLQSDLDLTDPICEASRMESSVSKSDEGQIEIEPPIITKYFYKCGSGDEDNLDSTKPKVTLKQEEKEEKTFQYQDASIKMHQESKASEHHLHSENRSLLNEESNPVVEEFKIAWSDDGSWNSDQSDSDRNSDEDGNEVNPLDTSHPKLRQSTKQKTVEECIQLLIQNRNELSKKLETEHTEEIELIDRTPESVMAKKYFHGKNQEISTKANIIIENSSEVQVLAGSAEQILELEEKNGTPIGFQPDDIISSKNVEEQISVFSKPEESYYTDEQEKFDSNTKNTNEIFLESKGKVGELKYDNNKLEVEPEIIRKDIYKCGFKVTNKSGLADTLESFESRKVEGSENRRPEPIGASCEPEDALTNNIKIDAEDDWGAWDVGNDNFDVNIKLPEKIVEEADPFQKNDFIDEKSSFDENLNPHIISYVGHSKMIADPTIDGNDWGDFDVNWSEDQAIVETVSSTNDEVPNNTFKELNISSERIENVLEKLENKNQWNWKSNWGVSLLAHASKNVASYTAQVSQNLTNVLETGIVVPQPEDMAKIVQQEQFRQRQLSEQSLNKFDSINEYLDDKSTNSSVEPTDRSRKSSVESVSDNDCGKRRSTAFVPLKNLVSGVTQISSKVITGGLDKLEGIGKKTITIIHENVPDVDRKVLSDILNEAKQENTPQEKKSKEKLPEFEILFDDQKGLVQLEALEILSKQGKIKIEMLLSNLQGVELQKMQETLSEVEELCELPEPSEIEETETLGEHSASQLEDRLIFSVRDIDVELTFEEIVDSWKRTTKYLARQARKATSKELYENGLSTLAEFTALAIGRLHKLAELLSVIEYHSTASEIDAISGLVTIFYWHINGVAARFNKHLNSLDNSDEINHFITNIFLEASNANAYIRRASEYLIPVLQSGAAK